MIADDDNERERDRDLRASSNLLICFLLLPLIGCWALGLMRRDLAFVERVCLVGTGLRRVSVDES